MMVMKVTNNKNKTNKKHKQNIMFVFFSVSARLKALLIYYKYVL